MGFLLRWVFAFGLLAGTYNPTQWNYSTWVTQHWEDQMPVAAFLGVLLLVGYIIYVRATLRSIGLFGMLLICAVIGTALWVAFDKGWISLDNPTVNTWIGLFTMSMVLAIGLSWSIVRRKLTGQADVDDVDE